MNDRIFAGVFAAGISYADREVEEHGDYKRLAFLPYRTCVLEVYKDCPPDLRKEIEADAKRYKIGDRLRVSTCDQYVTWGK